MTEATQHGKEHVAPIDPVFPRFFGNGEEQQPKLVGLIGYGLYEEARREWVDSFKSREGRYPTLEELHSYETSWTASRLDGLKNAAVQILASYADTVSREVEVHVLHRALRGRFIRSLAHWMISAILFVAAVLALLVGLTHSGFDPIGAYQAHLRPANSASVTSTVSPLSDPNSAGPIPRTPDAPADAPLSSSPPPASSGQPVPPARRSGR
jgi:hypothetical protein